MTNVIDKCFVMFYTRYFKGRPRDVGNVKIYICESRYNEVSKEINQIKTWKSCIPAEAYHTDYELYLFETPLRQRKVHTPLLDLLPENAKMRMDKPPNPHKWGLEDAPPILGNVYHGSETPLLTTSPSPEPEGDPLPALIPPPPPSQKLSNNITQYIPPTATFNSTGSPYPQEETQQGFTLNSTSAPVHPLPLMPQVPVYRIPNYVNTPPQPAPVGRPRKNQNIPTQTISSAYTLPVAIPDEILSAFSCDDKGQMMWFNMPPMDVAGKHDNGAAVGPSAIWLDSQDKIKAKREERRQRDLGLTHDSELQHSRTQSAEASLPKAVASLDQHQMNEFIARHMTEMVQ